MIVTYILVACNNNDFTVSYTLHHAAKIMKNFRNFLCSLNISQLDAFMKILF